MPSVRVDHPELADLAERLGGVALERIILQPAPGTATMADCERLGDSIERIFCELVDGTLIRRNGSWDAGLIQGCVFSSLWQRVKQAKAGALGGARAGCILWPGRVRRVSVALLPWDRFPTRQEEAEFKETVPDLVAEVVIDGHTPGELALKRADYLHAGTRLYWEILPEERLVTAYRPNGSVTVHGRDESLDVSPILDGPPVAVASFFEDHDRIDEYFASNPRP